MRSFHTLLIVLLASATLVACDVDEGPAEDVGESIDESVEDVREGTEDAMDEAGDAMEN